MASALTLFGFVSPDRFSPAEFTFPSSAIRIGRFLVVGVAVWAASPLQRCPYPSLSILPIQTQQPASVIGITNASNLASKDGRG
jgi:hypothetical protein